MVTLTTCPTTTCLTTITPGHVTKAVVIPAAPMHTALVYRCPSCGRREKVVAETVEWNRLKALHEADPIAVSGINEKELQLELSGELGAQDLINAWRAGPPPIIEAHIGKCGCPDCQRRLYGTRIQDN